MYAGRIARFPLVRHVEYAYVPRALLRKKHGTDKQTDGRTPDRYITLTVDAASVIKLTRCRPNGTEHYWPAACCPLVSYVTLHIRVLQTTIEDDDDRRQRL